MTQLSDDDLREIHERVSAASPGPWQAMYEAADDGSWPRSVIRFEGKRGVQVCSVDGDNDAANAEFIARARDDIQALLGEVARLRGS